MVPAAIRQRIREVVWSRADAVGWIDLPAADKTRVYGDWVRDNDIGQVLVRYMDENRVRVYLKDTVLKGYTRNRTCDATRPLRIAFGDDAVSLASRFEKPHGALTTDGRQVAWGPAAEWKTILVTVFERAREVGADQSVAVLLKAGGPYRDPEVRGTVEAAAACLDIKAVHWIEL
ncbi:MAG: hypothetical protein U1E26_00950 [Coriobacteriia bacterium]|nr:hypothetical protein [Coriobacteriia bacterium]